MAKISREFLPTEYGQLHVRIAGVSSSAKLPLICLHMAPQSGQDFEAFMKLAGQERLVIAPDYHGYGESDPIDDEAEISIEAYAKSIWQALDKLNIQKIEILGHHTGSKVGVEMALQFPKRVEKLTCIAISTMTPKQYASSKVDFKPLSNKKSDNALSNWWNVMKNYYDPDMPTKALKKKYNISVKSGPRFHLGFQASHQYNAAVLEKLSALETSTVIINPNDDLRDITPLAVEYIEGAILIKKPDWLPGFLDIKPQDVLDTLTQNLVSKRSRDATPIKPATL